MPDGGAVVKLQHITFARTFATSFPSLSSLFSLSSLSLSFVKVYGVYHHYHATITIIRIKLDSHECETMVRAVGEMCRELSRLRLSPVFTKYNFPHHESDNVGVMLCDRIATTRSVMIVMIRSKIVSALVRRLTLAFPYGRDSE